jgi:two-component sensor histidine kinase
MVERLVRWRARSWQRYVIALVVVALATLARLALSPFLGEVAPFLTYFLAVLFAAFIGGIGPALLAIGCSIVLAWFFFIPPLYSFGIGKGGLLLLVLFGCVSALMAVLVALINSIVERLLQQHHTLLSLRQREVEAQQLAIRELQHRTGNLLVVVKLLASKAFRDPTTLADDRAAFLDRIGALSKSIGLAGPDGRRTLSALLEQVLELHHDRINIKGCDIGLSDDALQQFALIAHELQTNAIKYGALSNEKGRVSVTGRVDLATEPAMFHLVWQERDGPPVKPPQRSGIGTTTLVAAPQYQGAKAVLEYDPTGLCYRYSIDLARIAPGARSTGAPGTA